MARDAELDRLKEAQNRAFQRKQDAYQVQQRAWEKRSSARDAMNRAYETKQRAHADQDRAWQHYQSVRSVNSPRIDSLNAQQERAFQNMKSSFDNASAAHARRDGAAAASYAADGHRYKAESQGYVAERRRLVDEIRSARAQHDAMKPAFQRAKDDFSLCRRAFNAAKTDHERAANEFKRAKADFASCANAFKSRLERVKAESSRRRENDRDIASRAGVVAEYLDNIKVRRNSDGSYDIYYGGIGAPDGFGHGHATIDRVGKLTHNRRPFDSNSPENFADDDAYIEFQKSKGHRGGFGRPHYGYIDGKPVTFALGWGKKSGETLLADGHVNKTTFRESANHNHYGSGSGVRDNAKDRGRYTGPGA